MSLQEVESDHGVFPAKFSSEAQEFARREGLVEALGSALEVIRDSFTVVGTPSVSLESAPEVHGRFSLVIEAPVAGDPAAVAASHWRFAVEVAKVLGPRRERITLVCNIQ